MLGFYSQMSEDLNKATGGEQPQEAAPSGEAPPTDENAPVADLPVRV